MRQYFFFQIKKTLKFQRFIERLIAKWLNLKRDLKTLKCVCSIILQHAGTPIKSSTFGAHRITQQNSPATLDVHVSTENDEAFNFDLNEFWDAKIGRVFVLP